MERNITEANTITQALRKITNGFYIVSAGHQDELTAGTIQWVTQACFDPPLLVICIQEGSHLNEVISKSNSFAVSILAEDQKHLVAPFSKPTKVEANQLNGFPYQEGQTGAPLLIDLPAFLECKVIESHSIGDHTIFVGEVINSGVRNESALPLVEWDTQYHYGG